LPATAPYDETVLPLDDPSLQLDRAAVAAGDRLFHTSCSGCHGGGLQSTGAPAPDLRESALAIDEEAVWSVLHDGALLPRGMPRFEHFSREQVHQIWSYVRDGARKELIRQKEGGAPGPTKEAHGSGSS
jgi:quinohemoprotein ethanol dehydrogenase